MQKSRAPQFHPREGKRFLPQPRQTAAGSEVRSWERPGRHSHGSHTVPSHRIDTALLPTLQTRRLKLNGLACVRALYSHAQLFVTLWTEARRAPLTTGFSRQEYWRGLPCPPPGDRPDPGIKPSPLKAPALAGGLFPTSATREALSAVETWPVSASSWDSNPSWPSSKACSSARRLEEEDKQSRTKLHIPPALWAEPSAQRSPSQKGKIPMSEGRRNSSPRQQEGRLLVSGHLKTARVPQDCQNPHSSLQSPSYKAQVTKMEAKTRMSWGPRRNEATNWIRGDPRPPRAWKRRRTNPLNLDNQTQLEDCPLPPSA